MLNIVKPIKTRMCWLRASEVQFFFCFAFGHFCSGVKDLEFFFTIL